MVKKYCYPDNRIIYLDSLKINDSSRTFVTNTNYKYHEFTNGKGIITYDHIIDNIGGFTDLFDLTSVRIPLGVETIRQNAFQYCKSLESIKIPKTVTEIEEGAFQGCESLTTITLPDKVMFLRDSAFHSCKSLETVNLSSSLTKISKSAFSNCTSLESVILPSNITKLDLWSFYGCTNLETINIDNITEFGEGCLLSCPNLLHVTINLNVEDFVPTVFSNSGIKHVTWNARNYWNSTTASSAGAPFSAINTQILTFTFGNTVEKIPDYICYGMTGLTRITIPSSILSIENFAFKDCSNLATITCNAIDPPVLGQDVFDGISSSAIIYVPSSSVSRYQNTSGWSNMNIQSI